MRKRKTTRNLLNMLLIRRGIPGVVYYSQRYGGWMFEGRNDKGEELYPQRLGYDALQAVEMITGGTLDFLVGDITLEDLKRARA